jgi:hypothetical protein
MSVRPSSVVRFRLCSLNAARVSMVRRSSRQCRYCSTCGIESYAEGTGPDGSPMVGINLRCVEGVDVDKLSPKPWDGRSK